MSKLIKGLIFWNKTLTDEELFQKWSQSGKSPEDFNASIIQMQSNAKTIITEISQIKLATITDIKNLVSFLIKSNQTTTSSTRKNKLVFIIENLQFIIKLHTITSLDSLVYFAFSNKYDIFSLLVQNLAKHPSLEPIISDVYYKAETYIDMLQYCLSNDLDRELKVLLPNDSNSTELLKKNCIPSSYDIKRLFKESYKPSITPLCVLWVNLMLYFNTNERLFAKLSPYIPNINQAIELISDLYSMSNEIESTSFFSFISKPIESQFNKLFRIEAKEKFIQISNRLLSFVNKNKGIMESIDLIPFNVIQSLLANKSLYDQIISFIDMTFKEGLYQPNRLKLFLVKHLIENYSDDLMSSKQLVALLNKIDSSIVKLGPICKEIEQAVKFISILNKEKIPFTLVEMMKNSFIKADRLINVTMEYLMKTSKDFRGNQFDFIDSNRNDINTLIIYINSTISPSEESIGSLLLLMVDFYPLMKRSILNVIISNKTLKLSVGEMTELIRRFIPIANDIAFKQTISDFLPLIADNKNCKDIHTELSLILNYITIKEVFNTYQISTDHLEESYHNIQNDQVLEIYLIKTFNVDQIDSIEDFIQKRPVRDIQNALHLNQGDFLYLLFQFFYKFQREQLYTQVLSLIKTESNLFIDCIKVVKRDMTKDGFIAFINKNNLKTYLLETSKYFSMFFNESMFEKKPSVQFSLSKDNLDLLSILAIEKLGLAPKALKAAKGKQLINEDYTKEREVIEHFYKEDYNKIRNGNENSLESLIELYSEKKIQSVSQVNYKYSLHPKLIELLNKQNYSHLIENVKIDFGSKMKLYKFLLVNCIIAIEHVFLYENLTNDNMASIDSLKLLFNLYNDKTQEQIDKFMKGKISLDSNQSLSLISQLIQVNLSTLKAFTYNNLLFISKYLSFDFESNAALPILSLSLMKIISAICPKFNLLPFLLNFQSEIYPSNANLLNRYYNDYSPMANLHFFLEQNNFQTKLQYVEIFKAISMNNWVNFIKIFNEIGKMEVNVLLIFVLKLIYNYTNTSGVMINQAKNGCIYLMNLLNSFKLNIEEIKVVLNDLYSYPQLTSILEGNQNILMLNQKVNRNIKWYSSSKMLLANEILSLYPRMNEFPIYVHKNKIFQIKNCIIRLIPDSEAKEVYNTIREMNDFNDLNRAMKNYPKIQKEIYSIYTLN